MTKYTKEILEEAARESTSVRQVVAKIGASTKSSNMQTHIASRLKKFEIDTSHFLGQASNRGKVSPKKRHFTEVLVFRDDQQGKESSRRLRMAMLESGILYKCQVCGNLGHWNNTQLRLEIDHIDGNPCNNLRDNLRFMCPNCHSQTETYGRQASLSQRQRNSP